MITRGAVSSVIRRRIILLALAALPALLPACASDSEPAEAGQIKNVTLLMKSKSGDYWKTVKMGAEAAAKEFSVELRVEGPDEEGDVNGQIELLNQSVKDGMDALVLAASDYGALGAAVDRMGLPRIPVIAIDSEAGSSRVKSFIGIDNVEAGQKAGKKLIELTGGRSRIAVISFGKGGRNAEQRERGLRDALRAAPGVLAGATQYCSGSAERCGELAALLLQREQADGIVALDAAASLGVAAETERLGFAGKVKIVTFDNTPEDIEYLQEGIIQATIVQNPFSMGYLGVKYAVDAMNGKRNPAFMDTGTKVIDQENMFWLDNQKLLFPFVK
ncbi:substrate-binding domain-containing protein [Paenibacillus doosanensis]|uniref:substrate-binding domain-containing protein n=1 Tax=Paenibacillus doosanensis TaxID=1229154 RepID=UPI00217F5F9B|nr:substrate-binding domain-containing protein [Paenibacillus doosanensis]MCS7463889.1 substrate-binding domain-containing protein [Paenibacillus doosanensis]